MILGRVDVLTSSGNFEGWCYNSERPLDPVTVAVVDAEGVEIAFGLAHRYREDLVKAHCGIGWCAFQLRADNPVSKLRKLAIRLIERNSGLVLFASEGLRYMETDTQATSFEHQISLDPTLVQSVEQLEGCGEVFDAYIRAKGVDAFVRTSYVYVLGRPADLNGAAFYGKLIRHRTLSPYALLRSLSESDEFSSRSRLLGAPNTTEFPFRLV